MFVVDSRGKESYGNKIKEFSVIDSRVGEGCRIGSK